MPHGGGRGGNAGTGLGGPGGPGGMGSIGPSGGGRGGRGGGSRGGGGRRGRRGSNAGTGLGAPGGPGGEGTIGPGPAQGRGRGGRGTSGNGGGMTASQQLGLQAGLQVAGIPGAIVGFGIGSMVNNPDPNAPAVPSRDARAARAGRGGREGGNLLTDDDEDTSTGPSSTVPTPGSRRDALDDAEDKARKKAARLRGRASTILTSGQGLLDQAPIGRRTLLGS